MSYRKCEICGLRSGRKDCKKRYFMARFPLAEARCKLWVKFTGNEDLAYVPIEKLHELKFLCGKHFKESDFRKKKTQLKKTAIPSLRLSSKPLTDEVLSGFPYRISKEHIQQKDRPRLLRDTNDHNYCRQGPLHHFPNPKSRSVVNIERFAQWKAILDTATQERGDKYIYDNFLLCNDHFLACYKLPSRRLTNNAVPSVNLFMVERNQHSTVDVDMSGHTEKPQTFSILAPAVFSQPPTSGVADTQPSTSRTPQPIDEEESLDGQSENQKDQEEFEDNIEETIDLADDEEKLDKDVEVIDEILLAKDTPAHIDFKCNVCNGDIVGFRYCCLQCADWDMCAACEAKGEHSMHYMLRIPALTTNVDSEPVIAAVREQIQNLLQLSKEIKSEVYLKEEADTEERTDDFIQELMDPLVTNDRSVPEYVHQDSLTQDDVLTNNRLTETMYTDCDMNTTDSSDTLMDLSALLTKEYRHKSKKQKTEAVSPELTNSILVTYDRSATEDLHQDSSTQDVVNTNSSRSEATDTYSDVYTSGSSNTLNNVVRLLNKESVIKPKKQVIKLYRKSPNNISQSGMKITLQELTKLVNKKYILVNKLKKTADS